MLHVFVYTAYPILSNYAQHKVTSVCDNFHEMGRRHEMFLQGPATHSWPAACSRSSAPRRRPGSRRAPCSPSATSGPQRGGSRRQLKNNILKWFFGKYNSYSHNFCHWIVHLTFSISSSLTSAPAHQRVVGCVHNGVNLEPGDVSLVQRHLWWRDCKRGHHNRPRCVLPFQTNRVPRWYCSLPKA